jgi:RNAse (barnase) inhibitor barstar
MRLGDLNKASVVAVHFMLPTEFICDFREVHKLAVVETSICGVADKYQLFNKISAAMHFPDYFGNNWDALDECLTDMEWLAAGGYVLILKDAAQAWSNNPYIFGKLVTTWLEAAEYWYRNTVPFHLVFIM